MAKFKFRLAKLLRLREAQRDERRGELAEAYRADEIMEARQREVESGLAELAQMCRRAAAPGPVDVDRLVETQRFEIVLRAQRLYLSQQRETLSAEIERRRGQLVEANREVRVLEKLEDRLRLRHEDEQQRREMKALDETAGMGRLLKEAAK
jgi:flagellar protein FliJ